MMGLVLVVIAGVTAYLIGTTIKSIRNERETKMRLWKNFGLSLGFCALFLITWAAHGIAEWQTFTDEQAAFTVMAAVLIHKGSAESRDSDDVMQMALKRIEDKLGTEPTLRTDALHQDVTLHVFPDSFEGWYLTTDRQVSRRATTTNSRTRSKPGVCLRRSAASTSWFTTRTGRARTQTEHRGVGLRAQHAVSRPCRPDLVVVEPHTRLVARR